MTASSTQNQPRTSWWLSPLPPREGLYLGIALSLLACLPVLLATYPQMSDYPAHLARYHVMLERANSPFLQQFYDFKWHWAGNLGADLLIIPLAKLFGLETGARIIVGLVPVLTGLSIITVGWALRGRIGFASLLAFSFIWQPSLLLGFLNYTLSLALALFAFAAWVKLERHRRLGQWRWALFIPIAPLIWLCHVSGWGVLGILVFGYEWSRNKSWRAFVAPWPLCLPFAMLLLGGGTKGSLQYGPSPLFFKQVLWIRGMRDQIEWLDIGSMILIGLIFLLVLGFRRIDGRIGWASIIMIIGSLAMPRHIFGGDYADYRLISAGLLAGCLSIAWRAPRIVLLLPVALFLTRLGVTSETWWRNSRETEHLLTALDHVPQGARVASLVTVGLGDWHFDTFEHVGGYATVRRDALTNMHFALPNVHMLAIREGVVPQGLLFTDPSQRLFVHKGQAVDLSHFKPAKAAEYLWFVGDDPAGKLPKGAVVVWRHRNALLARLAKPRIAR